MPIRLITLVFLGKGGKEMFWKRREIALRDHTIFTLLKFIFLILSIPLLLIADLMIMMLNMKARLTLFFRETV